MIENAAGELTNGLGPTATQAVRGFAGLFGNLEERAVRELVPKVYAEAVVFHDTLKRVEGLTALENYLRATARNVRSCRAQVQDAAPSGDGGVYVRWRMRVEFHKLAGGVPVETIGMTHLRFDDEGRIVFHQDYWDSTAGFFQHVPLLGRVLRWIRSRL